MGKVEGKKGMTNSKVDRLRYSSNECIIGRLEKPMLGTDHDGEKSFYRVTRS